LTAELIARPHGVFHRTHGETLGDRSTSQTFLKAPVGRAKERPGVTSRELSINHKLLDGRRQLKQAKCIGDHGPALSNPRGHLLVGQPEVLDELLVRRSFLNRVEVLAVEVLDKRLGDTGDFVGCPHEGWDTLEPGPSGCSPPSFASDDLVVVIAQIPDEDRLEDADLPDRSGEGGQSLFIELNARLVRIGRQVGDRNFKERRSSVSNHLVGD
jgi:hypothetical protein